MSLLFNMLSRLVTAFLPRSKHLLISLHFSKQRLGKAAKGLDDNNNHVCPKLGSLRWCLRHEMLIREFPWNRQLWGQEQEGQRSGCERLPRNRGRGVCVTESDFTASQRGQHEGSTETGPRAGLFPHSPLSCALRA